MATIWLGLNVLMFNGSAFQSRWLSVSEQAPYQPSLLLQKQFVLNGLVDSSRVMHHKLPGFVPLQNIR